MVELGCVDHPMLKGSLDSSVLTLEDLPGGLGSHHTREGMLDFGIAFDAASW